MPQEEEEPRPSGSPLVGTTSAVDGTFTLNNVPAGSNIPLVIQIGKWRRQVVLPEVKGKLTGMAFRLPADGGPRPAPGTAGRSGRIRAASPAGAGTRPPSPRGVSSRDDHPTDVR